MLELRRHSWQLCCVALEAAPAVQMCSELQLAAVRLWYVTQFCNAELLERMWANVTQLYDASCICRAFREDVGKCRHAVLADGPIIVAHSWWC